MLPCKKITETFNAIIRNLGTKILEKQWWLENHTTYDLDYIVSTELLIFHCSIDSTYILRNPYEELSTIVAT